MGIIFLLLRNISFFLFFVSIEAYLIEDYDKLPRIVLEDGHMHLVAAQDRSIKFITASGGKIYVNDNDLLQLMESVTEAARTINAIHGGVLTRLENRLNNLEEQVTGFVTKVQQVQQISNGSTIGEVPGDIDSKIKTLFSKTYRLSQVIRAMRNLLNTNECSSNPCRNGGTCEDSYNGFICRCPTNWEGVLCDRDVNECAQFAGTDLGCQNGATCLNKPGTYECQCTPNWFGIHCTRKTRECSRNSPRELCGNGICINQDHDTLGYTCICDQGWTTNGVSKTCTQDIDECVSSKPVCSKNPLVSCINTLGSFHCGPCPQGYSGNGYYCTDIDECQINNGGCSINPSVQCINTQGSRMCGPCPPGYQGDGVTCTYAGACRINNGGCHPLAQCIENQAISQSYVQCICPPGYTGYGMGPFGCTPNSPGPGSTQTSCTPNPCHHGTCIVRGNSFVCQCFTGFTGDLCSVSPCLSNPCLNGGTCTMQGSEYVCRCSGSYTGRHCEQQQQTCGGHLSSEEGTLKYPPGSSNRNYPGEVSCTWLIVSNQSKILNVTFKNINLEQSPECIYDWLQIHDGQSTAYPLVGRFCGSTLPNNITSTHNMLYIWFRSDHSNHGDGFELTWKTINPVCGGFIAFESHGTLNSPGYPGKYPPNRDCEWRLRAPYRKRILLHFYTMNIGTHPNCSFDYVKILDGYSNSVLKSFCNSSFPAPFTTPNSRVIIRFHSDSVGRDSGFQIAYSTTQGTDCGGVITESSGTISPPMVPGTNRYQHRLFCEWLIQLPEDETVQLTFQSLSLEPSEPCVFDYVEFREGNGPSANLALRVCGNQIPRPYRSNGNIVTVIFKSDSSFSQEGFSILYEAVCGGVYSASEGYITSPMYPLPYPRSKNCIYEISQPAGKSITLNFITFALEERGYRSNCYDYIQIRDGDRETSPLLGEYCGFQFPPTIISTYNYLWLKFHSDGSGQRKGFYANYTTQDVSCGGIMRDQDGILHTPNYPSVYPNSHICRWIIVADQGNLINLHWISFHLEGACIFDYVEVYENITDTGPGQRVGNRRYCGSTSPPDMTSTSNVITIVFQTDSSMRYPGFQARYTQINGLHICSANFISTVGKITSPNYPSYYPTNKDCKWVITVPTGQQIMLNVTDFELERSATCNWDYLEIRNGGYETSPLIGKYCGRMNIGTIPSISNQMYIRFVSDFSRSGRGFNITWDGTLTGCGGGLTGRTGHIISPHYPQPYGMNTECFYKIITSRGSIVQVVFVDLDLEETSRCIFDYLAFYDGEDSTSKLIGKYCSDNHPQLLVSSSNKLFVKFKSDISGHGRGFSLRYDTVCDYTLNGFNGVIESPNFPNVYPKNLHCNWKIVVPRGNTINITFSHFELGSNCQEDYVQISEKAANQEFFSNIGSKLCGSDLPNQISAQLNMVSVEFVTNDYFGLSGFRLEWILHGCGERLTHPTGQFTSPGYPGGYPDEIECEWAITVPLDKSIQLTIEDFNIERSGTCGMDVLTVYGGPDKNSPKLHDGICHKLTQPMQLTSSGNNMFITFKSDVSYSGRGFKISYKSVDTACGGIFTTPNGNIFSHNYPQNYDPHDDCSWLIKVDRNHVVKLTFRSFNLELHHNCSWDYVKVFDGNSTDSPVLATLCGNSLPNITTYVSTGNTMVVRMKADGSQSFSGFSANYSMSCGARIITEDYGSIVLSEAINNNGNNANCSWLITGSQPRDQITLTVTHMDLNYPYSYDGGDECNYNYLEIFDGEDQSSNRIGQYCGSRIPHQIVSHGSSLLLHLVSSYGYHYGYFSASYSVLQGACGGNLTSEHGAFASPGYPGTYSVNSECAWTISSPPGNRVLIGFRSFNLEQSEGCNKDYLEVRERGPMGRMIGVYCSDIPANITSAQAIWIKFHSDNDTSNTGFLADYSLLHGNELTGSSGQIASPLYPRPYIRQGIYTWRITVDFGFAIRISLESFFIETYSIECPLYLAVYDGFDGTAPLLMKKCGGLLPDPITSSSNIVFVEMNTYGMNQGSFFLLNWLQIENAQVSTEVTSSVIGGCSGSIALTLQNPNNTNNEYTLTSPGYPEGYSSGLTCEWIVEAPPTYHVAVSVNYMDLESSVICSLDYVALYKGTDEPDNWKHIKNLCHSNASSESPIDGGNLMKIAFKTDYSVNRTGFSLKLYPACGGVIKASNGVIDVKNWTRGSALTYYTQCEWNITVRAGRTIKTTIDRFVIRDDQRNLCQRFYVTFRNGLYPDSPILGNSKYCGSEIPQIPDTTGNHLSVIYRNYPGGQGFRMRFVEVSESCGGSFTLTPSNNYIEISSPRFPNSAPPHTECIWTFMAPGGEAIQVDFDPRFDFEYSDKCTKDYVELRDGGTLLSPLLGRHCTETGTQKTTGNMLWIKYFTDVPTTHAGFKANVSLAKCGGVIRGHYRGDISSPGYPRGYPRNTECVWRIEGYQQSQVSVQFKDVDFPHETPCFRTDHVNISEILPFSDTVIPVTTLCGSEIPPVTLLEGPIAEIKMKTLPTGSDYYKGFKANYSVQYGVCGGDVSTPYGEISSPRYPSYVQHKSCQWLITVPRGRRIRVRILDVNLELTEMHVSNLLFFQQKHSHFIDSLYVNRTLRILESTGNTLWIYFYTSRHASRFKLSYTSDQPAVCGGVVETVSGSLDVPLVTHAQQSYYCEWEYINNILRNRTFAVTFQNVTIGELSYPYCRYRSSKIRIISGENYQLSVDICRNYTQSYTVVSPFSRTKIIAGQVLSQGLVTFSAQYNVFSCGGVLTGPDETIVSPGYPNNYQNNLHCAWSVTFGEGKTILIHFNDFALEDQCTNDYVVVHNGPSVNSPSLGRFCGSSVPQNITSQSNMLWIEFHSNSVSQFKGFSVSLSTVSNGCGGILHEENSIISTPHFPNQYPANAECEWEIRVEDGYYIQLKFVDRFHLELSSSCSNDFVEVYDYIGGKYASSSKKFCGRDIPQNINSTSTRLKVRFRSNGQNEGDGFKAVWTKNCGGMIENVTRGQIISPGYPVEYGNGLNCNYTVLLPGHYIRVQFDSFDLENSCKFDNVTVQYHHGWGSIRELGPYCSSNTPPSFVSKDYFTLIFKTDFSVQRRGFMLNFRSNADCGGDIQEPGRLVSPDVYMQFVYATVNCTWVITAPANSVVVARFASLSVSAYLSCDENGVSLYDGPFKTQDNSLGTFCGNLNNAPPVVRSSGNKMVLQFMTYSFSADSHFAADILFTIGERSGCGGKINVSQTVSSISSSSLDLNHDGNYDASLDCHWTLTANPNQVIHLQTTSFDVKPCENVTQNSTNYCTCDFLEIFDGGNQYSDSIGKYCGAAVISPVISSGNQLWIRFRTDADGNGRGFTLQVQAQTSRCSTPLLTATPALQVLTSPNYPNNYPTNLRCNWLITAGQFEKIAIHIEYLNITGDKDCSTSMLKFTDDRAREVLSEGIGQNRFYYGQTLRNRPVGLIHASRIPISSYTFCGEIGSFNYYSNSGSVSVTFSSNENVAKGFNLTYSKAGCNRNYTADQGRIHMLDSDIDCFMIIETSANKTISLYFAVLHSSFDCEASGLEVNDGATASDPQIERSCGYTIPNPMFSSGNALWLHTWNRQHYGFQVDITYTTTDKGRGCGGEIFNYGGTFTSPFYPNNYRNSSVCRWDVSVPYGKRVALRFKEFQIGPSSTCNSDFIELLDVDADTNTETVRTRLCGGDSPALFLSESTKFVVRYTTSVHNGGTGWVAVFTATTPGQRVHEDFEE